MAAWHATLDDELSIMNKTLTILASLCLTLATGCGLAHATTPIKIGFMSELSGPQAALGQDKLDALMLYVEQHNGQLGGKPVQIIKRDSQLKPEVANQIADELIQKEKVAVVTGFSFTNIMMAVAHKFAEANIPVLSASAGPAPIAGEQCNEHIFVLSKQNDQFAEAMGVYAKEQDFKRVITFAPNYQAGKDFVQGFKRRYEAELLDEIYTPLGQLDFSTEISRIMAMQPDAVYVFYPGGLGISFVRAYKQAGLLDRIPLLSVSTVDGTTLPALQHNAVGAFSASDWGPDLDNPSNHEFVDAFATKYNRMPSEYAAQSYDVAKLLDAALAKVSDTTDTAALTQAIKNAEFESVRGQFAFGHNNFPIQDFYVFEVAPNDQGQVSLRTVTRTLKNATDSYADACLMN